MNVKKFMKNANREDGTQKTIAENMKDLGASEDAIEYAMYIIERQKTARTRLSNKNTQLSALLSKAKQDLELLNRVLLPIEKRFLSHAHVKSSKSKITINPCDGRCELKVHEGASDKVEKEMKELLYKAQKCEKFTPRTYRGTIRWRKELGVYEVILGAENKGISSVRLTYDPVNYI